METLEAPPEPKKKSTNIRKHPDPKELKAVQEFLKREFRRGRPQFKFLYNVENCYRFRVNIWSDVALLESHFILATATPDGIVMQIKPDKIEKPKLIDL